VKRQSAAVLIVSMTWFTTGCVVIEDGEVGVSKSFGEISDEPLLAGVAFVAPIIRTVETWNVKLQELKETAQVPSAEGLVVGLDTSLMFKVMPDSAPSIRKTIGWNYVDRLIVPYFRSGLRDVVAGYGVKQVYTASGRKEIAEKVKEFLVESLEPQGIEVVSVLLRDVELPARFKESIGTRSSSSSFATSMRPFRSVRDLIQQIEAFINHYNRKCRPFAWTATSDSIFEKLERLSKTIAGTGH
jgi:regulator of protease activity HflC (stomatin/prohibitin superfamily)